VWFQQVQADIEGKRIVSPSILALLALFEMQDVTRHDYSCSSSVRAMTI
jgi:hypothetical protein